VLGAALILLAVLLQFVAVALPEIQLGTWLLLAVGCGFVTLGYFLLTRLDVQQGQTSKRHRVVSIALLTTTLLTATPVILKVGAVAADAITIYAFWDGWHHGNDPTDVPGPIKPATPSGPSSGTPPAKPTKSPQKLPVAETSQPTQPTYVPTSAPVGLTPTQAFATTITITRLDNKGRSYPGACFEAFNRRWTIPEVCDGEDGDLDKRRDGQLSFRATRTGIFTLRETQTPLGVRPADDRRIQIGRGGVAIEVITEQSELPNTGSGTSR
jgi:hypothetical protein